MSENAADPRPFLVLTVLLDGSARPAAVTRSHADAMERAYTAIGDRGVAGVDIIELPLPPPTFSALRKYLQAPEDQVGFYDLFPLSASLDPQLRVVAGQFLAAEALWTLEDQGQLGGVPVNVKLDIPNGWEKDPKAIHAKLLEAGALELSPEGIETFKTVKSAWDAAGRASAGAS
ncbi:MAG TPA: hypothetical protein RMF84_10430 [Polyangiaceae bacterium LLY-WYZ-14_1]|nr:hypothetical protein [Polyangiaceae bacterium LLY-WYZ-14_1]